MLEEILNSKLKKTLLMIFIPQCINIVFTLYCFFTKGITEFKGAILGTLLGIVFFVIWSVIVKRVSLSNILVLFAYTLGAFPVKLIIFALFVLGGLYLIHMDHFYFVVTFLFSTMISLIIEVGFIVSINNIINDYKKNNRQAADDE